MVPPATNGSSLTYTKWVSFKCLEHASFKRQQLAYVLLSSGYYRVLYDGTNLDLLLDQLLRNRSVIRLTNRAQLLDDYLNLARADMVPYAQALSLTKYLVHETDYLPWAAASTALDYIDQMLFGLPDYQDWIVSLFT